MSLHRGKGLSSRALETSWKLNRATSFAALESDAMTAYESRWRIAKALDLTEERVRQFAKIGMPLDVEGAIAWRKQHVPQGRKPPRLHSGEKIGASARVARPR